MKSESIVSKVTPVCLNWPMPQMSEHTMQTQTTEKEEKRRIGQLNTTFCVRRKVQK